VLILNVLQGPDKGRRFELPDTEPQIIGRSSEALPLTDMTISRRHAELTPDEGKWLINDQKSANGTYVNGVRIEKPTLLRSGDQIRVGSTLMVFGRVAGPSKREHPVRVLRADEMDAAVERAVPSNDDSVIMAVPEPTAEAQQQLTVLYQLMQVVGSNFDRQMLLERVMDLVFENFEADRGFVLMMQNEQERPEPVVVRYRRDPRGEDDRRIMTSRTIVQHVIHESEGVLSSNAMSDKRFASGDSVQAYGIRSVICVPIKFHDRIFGVLHIDSQIANYTFTEDQLRLMIAIGALTGMALSNAELYQQGLTNARLAAVGETVASLSHSIKNILQGMRGGAEVVEMGLARDDMNILRNGWTVLARNLTRIYELTMNMLAYSKQRKPEMEMVQLRTMLGEVTELVQAQCDRRDIALITEYEGDMPPIPADPGGLHQAIMNLLNNAMDAVEPGSGVVSLRCEYDAIRHIARIMVGDNGSGIDRETMRHIFQPFYSTKGQRGTGLGLAVTRKVIEEHGGRIQVETDAGKGTTVTLSLSTESRRDPSATSA
jgi:two-component system NtrC family sensor kinase